MTPELDVARDLLDGPHTAILSPPPEPEAERVVVRIHPERLCFWPPLPAEHR